jgi:hypothetical protein
VLSEDEFIDSFATLTGGTRQQRARIAFAIHDVGGRGYIRCVIIRLNL